MPCGEWSLHERAPDDRARRSRLARDFDLKVVVVADPEDDHEMTMPFCTSS